MSYFGHHVMTSNGFSIHIKSGDIFYENYDTGENLYDFLMVQQDENAANIPKKFAYRNTFEKVITNITDE